MVKGLSPETPGQRVCTIFLVYCIASVVLLCICVVSCPYVTFSYCYGTIYPICAESAVKPQTNKHFGFQCCQTTDFFLTIVLITMAQLRPSNESHIRNPEELLQICISRPGSPVTTEKLAVKQSLKQKINYTRNAERCLLVAVKQAQACRSYCVF